MRRGRGQREKQRLVPGGPPYSSSQGDRPACIPGKADIQSPGCRGATGPSHALEGRGGTDSSTGTADPIPGLPWDPCLPFPSQGIAFCFCFCFFTFVFPFFVGPSSSYGDRKYGKNKSLNKCLTSLWDIALSLAHLNSLGELAP